MLADVLENFRNMCIEIYELDPAKFLSASELALQAALKKAKVKLELLADIDILLMVEKVIRGLLIDMQNLMTNISKIMIKTKNRDILNIGT